MTIINVLPELSGDSVCTRLTFQPDTENVLSRVYVPIVGRSAVRTNPVPYSKRAYTFRAAARITPAARTHLGSKSLIGFNVRSSVPAGLVAEHRPERRPACIQNGFSHSGFSKLGWLHIADNDQTISTRNLCAFNMKMMPARIGNLCVDGSRALFITRPLSLAESSFIFSIMLHGGNRLARGERCQSLQTKVYTHRAIALRRHFLDLTVKAYIPAATSVLDDGGGLNNTLNVSRIPNTEALAVINKSPAICANGTPTGRNPSQAFNAAPKSWTFTTCIAANGKLPANFTNRIASYCQETFRTYGKLYQVKMRRPLSTKAFSFLLNLATVIPHEINISRIAQKLVAARPIFNPVFIGDDHVYA